MYLALTGICMKQEEALIKQIYKILHSARRSGSVNEMCLAEDEAIEKSDYFTVRRLSANIDRVRHSGYSSIGDLDLNLRLYIYKELKKNNKHNDYRITFIK